MEADFSGYVTKANLRCSDGRIIMPDAFAHQDKMQVPLVWQHGHTDPENVLGHVLLENRADGVYGQAFFNSTAKAKHAQQLVEHKDINMMSIWANNLVERAKQVFHGAIREVSLVLAGANPGAVIESVNIRHADGELVPAEDEGIIYTGEPIELKHETSTTTVVVDDKNKDQQLEHAVEETVADVYNSMTDKQQQVLAWMIGQALSDSSGSASHSDLELTDETITDEIYDSMSEAQQALLHFMVGEAMDASNSANDDDKDKELMHNLFENADGTKTQRPVLSHAEVQGIVADAMKREIKLSDALNEYAIAHNIQDIDILFPEARTVDGAEPELFGRRTEWVNSFLGGVRKSPFARIKSLSADITVAEARAKGYIKGTLKKEEFFRVARRVTNPTTIYKKQKLDRDDMIDIVDFNVVTWLKREMRVMLDEEIARAALIGDGRAVDDPDKIDEDAIRPIARDHEVYTTRIYVNIDDANSSMNEVVDEITRQRGQLRGTGLPTLYTTETFIGRFMTQRDSLQRRIYTSLEQLATELRVREIVAVEVLEEDPDIIAILVNPVDYVMGADRGGEVSMFDDFDIDYNQYKYLIETRCSGALTRLKSALVVLRTAGANVLVVPQTPAYDAETGTFTVPTITGVVYRNDETDAILTTAGGPYTVPEGDTVLVTASPAAGYYFETSDDDSWVFENTPA